MLNIYYQATRPVRWWNHLRAAALARVPVVILFYHRVAESADNPWTVSHRMFARQVSWLRRNFELVSLAEAQRRIRRGANHRPCACITFDDGYADNCTYALPLLLTQQIPFAYFVTLHNVLSGEPFAHDSIWGIPCAPNTLEQICTLAEAGVEIGSHGFSHIDLGAIDNRRVLDCELADSRDTLQRMIRRPVRYFAFPFGQPKNITSLAMQAACDAGYEAVCSAYGGLNYPGDDFFHLLRIGVDDDLIGLINAATGDPRKLRTRQQALLWQHSAAEQQSGRLGRLLRRQEPAGVEANAGPVSAGVEGATGPVSAGAETGSMEVDAASVQTGGR